MVFSNSPHIEAELEINTKITKINILSFFTFLLKDNVLFLKTLKDSKIVIIIDIVAIQIAIPSMSTSPTNIATPVSKIPNFPFSGASIVIEPYVHVPSYGS
jgi:hypothetical protein